MYTWSAFNATKNSQIFETGTNGTQISRERLEIVEFLKSELFDQILEIPE